MVLLYENPKMNLSPLTDREKIAKRKCEAKDCHNKATAIFKKKFLCEECYSRKNPTRIDKKLQCVNYLLHLR